MLTAEIAKGKTAERFRALIETPALRKPRREDLAKMAKKGGAFAPGQRVKYAVHEPKIQGAVTGDKLAIDAGKDTVHKIVFYAGPVEAEEVVGSVEVNAAGKIEVELVQPTEAKAISEADLAGE